MRIYRGLLGLLVLVALAMLGVVLLRATADAPPAVAAAPALQHLSANEQAPAITATPLSTLLSEGFESGTLGVFTGTFYASTSAHSGQYAAETAFTYMCEPDPSRSVLRAPTLWSLGSDPGKSPPRPPGPPGDGWPSCDPFVYSTFMRLRNPVPIPALTDGEAVLSFWHYYYTNSSGPNSVGVEISPDNGVSWLNLATWSGAADWEQTTIRLSDYIVNRPILVQFRASIECSLDCLYDWVVDDIQITVYAPGVLPTSTPTIVFQIKI